MFNWHIPSPSDFENIYNAACRSCEMGNDAAANIFFYRNKFNIEIAFSQNVLLRRYKVSENDYKYGFPIGLDFNKEKNTLFFILHELEKEACLFKKKLNLTFVNDKQKKILEMLLPDYFEFTEKRNDSDYIYLSENLAELSGKKFHKKRNHISQFYRKYSEIQFIPISKENAEIAWEVEEKWFLENNGNLDFNKTHEKQIIKEMLLDLETGKIFGGILFADGEAAAMTLGSPVSPDTADVNFEKAIAGFDKNGAYSVINKEFAKMIFGLNYKYINREEDMGIEGLRKSKLSYYPDIILTKWNVKKVKK